LILIDKQGNLRDIELLGNSSFFRSLPPGKAYSPMDEKGTVCEKTTKPQPGLTPDWGFLVTLSFLPLGVRDGLFRDRFHY